MRPANKPGVRWRGESLRIRRVLAGYTLEGLAAAVGCSPSTLARWEAEENEPTAEMVDALAKTLGVKRAAFGRVPKIR